MDVNIETILPHFTTFYHFSANMVSIFINKLLINQLIGAESVKSVDYRIHCASEAFKMDVILRESAFWLFLYKYEKAE